jgi:very-short-patch-repair endonuclease
VVEGGSMSKGTFKTFTPEERHWIRKSYATLGQPYGDPYSVCPHDFSPYMSPIEDNVWHDIRMCVPQAFLLQYPCGPYFIDFASPKLKVALEVDGRQYHTDPWKDYLRDQFLLAHGYDVVFHIPGFVTFQELVVEPGHTGEYDGGWYDYEGPMEQRLVRFTGPDGGFMRSIRDSEGIANPYQSPFADYVTYRELMAYVSEKAWQSLPDDGEPRKFGSGRNFDAEIRARLKKLSDACLCGQSWWRHDE